MRARTAFRSGSLRSGEVVFVLGQQQGDGFFNERYDADPFLRGQDLEFDDGGGRQVGLQQALADAVGSPFGRSSRLGVWGSMEQKTGVRLPTDRFRRKTQDFCDNSKVNVPTPLAVS